LETRKKISVIIPVYNEEKTVCRLQESLQPIKNRCEILFVDGGSLDKTLSLISQEFNVLYSLKGRANQMNYGACRSTGEVLFFLHCDSEIPPTALEEIEFVLETYQAGCFGIAFHSSNVWMKCCQHISNHRIKDRKVMFGDQGIFVERKLFFEAGMFPNLPIMEDYRFSLKLKEMKVRLGMTKSRIFTSDRRFSGSNVRNLKLMWKMNRLRAMYRRGVPIEEIHEMYQDIR
jgi:rSAM/selenodomain-associated transferase 2